MEAVGIYKQKNPYYSDKTPYYPSSIFKEYPFRDDKIDRKNQVYASLRQLFRLLELDLKNFDTKHWNPFDSFISPGNTVLLKPNFVRHFNKKGDVRNLITHGSLIRAVIDYVYIALKGKGRIIIADGPMNETDFNKIIDLAGLEQIRRFYKEKAGFDVEIYDLRQEAVVRQGDKVVKKIKLKGDPAGYAYVELKEESEFKKGCLDPDSLSGPESRQDSMSSYHSETRDSYLISNTLLNSDVVINLPKMKTHKRSGVTLSLKNMVGITGDRNWLPHFSRPFCAKRKEGPERLYAMLARTMFKFTKKCVGILIWPFKDSLKQAIGLTKGHMQKGDWHGNDVIWRMIIDLARIVSYADKKGIIRKDRQRRLFIIVDGIIAGEGEGPLDTKSKKSGVLIAGFSDFCVDVVTSRLMGFDPLKIPKFKKISKESLSRLCNFDFRKIKCVSNIKEWDKYLSDFTGSCLDFKAHPGWKVIKL